MKTFRTTFLFLLLCALLLASLVHAQEETDGQQDTDLFEKDALDIDDAGMDMETEEEDAVAAAANKVCSVMMPMQGTIWKAGDRVTVSWNGATTDMFTSIALMQGADRQLVAILATNVSTAEGKYDMRLPTNIAPSNDYAIMLITNDETPDANSCASGSLYIENDGTAVGNGGANDANGDIPKTVGTSATEVLPPQPPSTSSLVSPLSSSLSSISFASVTSAPTAEASQHLPAQQDASAAKPKKKHVSPADVVQPHYLLSAIFLFASGAMSAAYLLC